MRKTLMTLAMAGVLFVAACGQDDPEVTAGSPAAQGGNASVSRTKEAAAGAAGAAARSASQRSTSSAAGTGDEAAAATTTSTTAATSTTTPSTTPTTVAAGPPCGGGPAPAEPAEPAVQTLRRRPADAPPECLPPEAPPTTEASGPTAEPVLGTGDVQVTLRWESNADVDLHVTEPDGTEIWFGSAGPTTTGGQLDVDSNVGCVQEASVENVFWPTGGAPVGEYTIGVDGYEVAGCGSGAYTVTAKVRGETVLTESGEVAEGETDTYTITV